MPTTCQPPPDPSSVFTDVPAEFPAQLFPEALGAFVSAVAGKYAVDPSVVGAAVLVATAAAFGPGHLIDTWTPTSAPASFNFILVGKGGMRLQGALDTVFYPFVREVQERRMSMYDMDRQELQQRCNRDAQVIADRERRGIRDEEMRQENGKRLGMLRPELLLDSVTLSKLKVTLFQSIDLSILLRPGPGDAAEHWLELGRAERLELAGVLRRSWDSKVLALPEFPHAIHAPLLWRMSSEKGSRLLKCPELFGDAGVPLFLIEMNQSRPATQELTQTLEIEGLWHQLVKTWLDWRAAQNSEFYSFSPEAGAKLIDYINLVDERSNQVAADQWCFVEFLPEAVRRLSLVFGILTNDSAELVIHREAVDTAIGVIEWYGRESLRLATSLMVPVPRSERPATIPSLRERMLRRVEERGPIRWRDLRRTFANSTDALLTPVREQLIADRRIGWIHGSRGGELVTINGGDSGNLGEIRSQTTAGSVSNSAVAKPQPTLTETSVESAMSKMDETSRS